MLIKWRAIVAGAALLLASCTNAALVAAQHNLAAGRFQQAHDQLTDLLRSPGDLSARDRRAAQDDLCQTEVSISSPAFSFARQYRDCQTAANEPDSKSAALLAQVSRRWEAQEELKMARDLRAHDLAAAVETLASYERLDNTDGPAIERWNAEIWRLVRIEEQVYFPRRSRRRHALQMLAAEHPKFRAMTRTAFIRWVSSDGMPSESNSTLEQVQINGQTLKLTVAPGDLRQASFGPATFAHINDAFSAWCNCYGDTHVVAADTGLPVYLSRINTNTQRSEVLELPR